MQIIPIMQNICYIAEWSLNLHQCLSYIHFHVHENSSTTKPYGCKMNQLYSLNSKKIDTLFDSICNYLHLSPAFCLLHILVSQKYTTKSKRDNFLLLHVELQKTFSTINIKWLTIHSYVISNIILCQIFPFRDCN